MVKITCLKCHWSWSLGSEEVKAAFESLTAEDKYYAVGCPKCRRVNKVTRKQLKRALPRAATESTTPQQKSESTTPEQKA